MSLLCRDAKPLSNSRWRQILVCDLQLGLGRVPEFGTIVAVVSGEPLVTRCRSSAAGLALPRKRLSRKRATDYSRKFAIPEGSGTASRKGPGLARPIRSVHFRLQNLACPGLRARVVAAWGNSQSALRAAGPRSGSKPAHGSQRRNGGNGFPQAVPVLLFFPEVSRDPLPVLPGPPSRPVACVGGQCGCCGGSHKPRRRNGPAPAQRDGAGTGGAQTGPATFLDPGGRSLAIGHRRQGLPILRQ